MKYSDASPCETRVVSRPSLILAATTSSCDAKTAASRQDAYISEEVQSTPRRLTRRGYRGQVLANVSRKASPADAASTEFSWTFSLTRFRENSAWPHLIDA